jgi:hypothetical protein
MALTLPIYKPTIYVDSITIGGGGNEGTEVQLRHTSSNVPTPDYLNRGALIGLNAVMTSANSGTVTVRAYRGASKTNLVLEVDVVFSAQNDQGYVQLDLPAPYFNSLYVTADGKGVGGLAGATIKVIPDVLAIAGN